VNREIEAVIGLEVHAQLTTRTKIFCGCPTDHAAPPNTRTCAVCLGHPGALPVLNKEAVRLAVRAAAALGCEIRRSSVFARKNYFYPDLPKGYQISQYDQPLASGGEVSIEVDGESRTIGLIRLHLEEDAGKSIHDGMPDSDSNSYIDLNRAGTPLIEIVSQPELRSAEEAYRFLQRLRSILRYTEVCDGNLEQGSLRCDANVSIRRQGDDALGTRTELKNLNSFRNVQRALEYEIGRQTDLVASGGDVVQQSLLWDAGAAATRPMRRKEEARDYRYFPEPDLPALCLDAAWIDEVRGGLPELPAERKQRMRSAYHLTEYEAQLLSLEAALADYYEKVAAASGSPKAAANFVLNDLMRAQNNAGHDVTEIPLPADHLVELIRLVDEGTISVTLARQDLFPLLYEGAGAPRDLVRERGWEQVSDEQTLDRITREVLAAHPDQVEQYCAGKRGLLGFLVGRVMKASQGKANPRKINAILEKLLD